MPYLFDNFMFYENNFEYWNNLLVLAYSPKILIYIYDIVWTEVTETYSYILVLIIIYNVLAILYTILLQKTDTKSIYYVNITFGFNLWFLSLIAFNQFLKHGYNQYQLKFISTFLSYYGINFAVGVDWLSLCFLMLTTFIIPICIFAANTTTKNYKLFIIYLLLIEFSLILTFVALDILMFYIFFESVLIPMFLIIGHWGSRERKIKAAYYLFIYTIAGSFLLLISIFWLYVLIGTTSYESILNFDIFYSTHNYKQMEYLWWFLFIPFAIKIPIFPFHIWLAEAHVEAPTIGSVILASLLLKLGGYGLMRILFYVNSDFISPNNIAHALTLASIIFASLTTIRQIDLKRIVAYSSIAHMNLIVLGILSMTKHGLDGAMYLMVGHAFVSSALFFSIGVLYERYHTRLIRYYGGLTQTMPIFSVLFLIFTLSNMSFPGTSNFIGELLIFMSIPNMETITNNFIMLTLTSSTILLSAIYSIWLYNRIFFGNINTNFLKTFSDLTFSEFVILLIWTLLIFIFGICSDFLLLWNC